MKILCLQVSSRTLVQRGIDRSDLKMKIAGIRPPESHFVHDLETSRDVKAVFDVELLVQSFDFVNDKLWYAFLVRAVAEANDKRSVICKVMRVHRVSNLNIKDVDHAFLKLEVPVGS